MLQQSGKFAQWFNLAKRQKRSVYKWPVAFSPRDGVLNFTKHATSSYCPHFCLFYADVSDDKRFLILGVSGGRRYFYDSVSSICKCI